MNSELPEPSWVSLRAKKEHWYGLELFLRNKKETLMISLDIANP